jgi:hypothetical protein
LVEQFHVFLQYYYLNFHKKFLFFENLDILSMDELDHDDIQDDNNQHNLPKNHIFNKKNKNKISLLEMVHVVLEFQLK